MSSDRRDDRKDREFRSRPNDTNRNDSKSIRCRVFVGNLATEELSRQGFEDIFIKHGRVIGCSVHNGYGFVQYEKESSADMAVAKEHGTTIKGKRVGTSFNDLIRACPVVNLFLNDNQSTTPIPMADCSEI